MTITINDFVITGTPEEIDTFIKLHRQETNTITSTFYTTRPSVYTGSDFYEGIDPNKWTRTCNENWGFPCGGFKGDPNDCIFK